MTVSRGPEYGEATWDAKVASGETARPPFEGAITIPRVVYTSGAIGVAIAPRFAKDDDTRAWIAERATSGVEAAIAGTDVAPSLAAIAKAMRVGQRFAIVASDDVAKDAFPIASAKDADALVARVAAKTPVTAVASTEAPDARTYVGVADDGAIGTSTNDTTREGDVVRGLHERRDVVVSNGPFARVAVSGAPVGSLVRARPGAAIDVRVHVACAADVTLDRARLLRASGAIEEKPIALASSPSGARVADVRFTFAATGDDAVVVALDAASDAGDAAWVVTGATWIDATGDGASLGRTPPPPPPPPEPTDAKKKRDDKKDKKKEKR